ncbi:MAG TPA: hypothetical protein PK257_01025 [Candidatus Woesebacteria bacterium]|nr:hypothetical protein [Candidatus Woesebacteria bacterium]
MKHKKLSIGFGLSAIVILFLSLFSPFKAYGQSYSQGGKAKLSIDKKIRSIGDTKYYDNIEASRKTFYEKDVVEFQIRVENISDEVVYNIKTEDILPKYLTLIFYPGNFNKDQYIVDWNIDKLEAGESKTYLIRAKINDTNKLSTLTKQTNKVESCGGGSCDQDYASYFIGKTTVPATGASDIILKTILVTLTAGSGIYFRKKARGY